MPTAEPMTCAGCGSNDFYQYEKDELFIIYRCKQCGKEKWFRRQNTSSQPLSSQPSSIEKLIQELAVTLHHWKSQDQRSDRFHALEEERRHLEVRLDNLENELHHTERLDPSLKINEEIEQILGKRFNLHEKINGNLVEALQATTDLKLSLKIVGEAIENCLEQRKILAKRNKLLPESAQKPVLDLSLRLTRLNQLKLEIEVTLIRIDFPVLNKIPKSTAQISAWDSFLQELERSIERLRNEFRASEARDVVRKELLELRAEARQTRDGIRLTQLEKLLKTNLSAPLPESLGELGREMDLIDRDLKVMNSTGDPLAKEVITRLEQRRGRVVNQIRLHRFEMDVRTFFERCKAWLEAFPEKVSRWWNG